MRSNSLSALRDRTKGRVPLNVLRRIQGRDELLRIRHGETQQGRGAPRPYQTQVCRRLTWVLGLLSSSSADRTLFGRSAADGF